MYSDLLNLLPAEAVRINEPMLQHTTFKIGGPVDVLVLPETVEQIQIVFETCSRNDIPLYVIGQGSNLLVRDKGVRGVVMKLGNTMKQVRVEDNRIYAEAGIRLSHLSKIAASHSLSGLEFAEGIPGSLGGAITMNAGAYGGEMKDVVDRVLAIDEKGREHLFTAQEACFAYRKSIFQENAFIVLSVELVLKQGNAEAIHTKMKTLASTRREKQPLELPSAGSVFRRPEGHYVGPMIEKLGLKGYRIGGAEVSTKHAGFIVNAGGATAEDVLRLIEKIQKEAKACYNVDLEPELRIIGEE